MAYDEADNNIVKYKLRDGYLEMSQPGIQELPYANHSFFEVLLQKIKPDEIITIFTVMLLEKKVLLIAPKEEQLLPLTFALHSLIYPFKYCNIVPYLEREDLEMLTCPMGIFFGILKNDKEFAISMIDDEYENRPAIYLEISDDDFGRSTVNRSTQQFSSLKVLNNGMLEVKKDSSLPTLPSGLRKELLSKIEQALLEKKNICSDRPFSTETVLKVR